MAAEDPGLPIAYLALEEGTPVFAADGARIGTVEHVLADLDADIFDGLLVDVDGGGHRFADAEQVGPLFERRAELRVGLGDLTEPTENAATMGTDPSDTAPDTTGTRLRRAWDYLSGKY